MKTNIQIVSVYIFGFLVVILPTPSTFSQTFTWVDGDSGIDQNAVYGQKGIPTQQTTPGGREGSQCWKGQQGNFWLFGGAGFGSSSNLGTLNDLWRYNPQTRQWTWMGGDTTIAQSGDGGHYGTKGVPSLQNYPGARGGGMTWVDTAGNFWLYGGYGYDWLGVPRYLADLWKYNPTTGLWTWMKGPKVGNQSPVYGTKGQPAPSNHPGSRNLAMTWRDDKNNLWLFSGNTNTPYPNDLWKYDPSTNQWTWMKGDSAPTASGTYGTKGVYHPSNNPPARPGAVALQGKKGNFWLFGGGGNALGNDLWQYNPSLNQWRWVSGPDTTNSSGNSQGNYTQQGKADPASLPPPAINFMGWVDTAGDLWFYTLSIINSGTKYMDLWEYSVEEHKWIWWRTDSSLSPSYGIKDSISKRSHPGPRMTAYTWQLPHNEFYLYGGDGQGGYKSDLWRLDITPLILDTQRISATYCAIENQDSTKLWVKASGRIHIFYQWLRNGKPVPGATDDTLLITNSQQQLDTTYRCRIISGCDTMYSQPVTVSHLQAGFTADTTITCPSVPDGQISVNATGGLSPLTYSIDDSTWQNSPVFDSLPQGSYTIRVRDSSGAVCPVGQTTITAPPPLSLNATHQDEQQGGDGRITATPSGGTPPYSYALDSSAFQSDSVFTGLSEGSYTVTIRDANGCTTDTVLLIEEADDTVGIDDKEQPGQKGVRVYPNPVRSVITVDKQCAGPIHFQLHEVTGRIVLHRKIDRQQTRLSVQSLPKGIYFYHINHADNPGQGNCSRQMGKVVLMGN